MTTYFAETVKLAGMAGRPAKSQASYPNRLRAVRERLRLTLNDVAKPARMTAASLARLETGERELKVHQLETLAKCLGVPASALLCSVDPIEDEQERAIASIFKRLTPTDRDYVIRMANALVRDEGAAGEARKLVS